MKKKIVRTNTWVITEHVYEDGKRDLRRENTGFCALELMGICTLTINELTMMMNDPKKWSKIVRVVK